MPTTNSEQSEVEQKPVTGLKQNLYYFGLPAAGAGLIDLAVLPIDRWITRIQSKQPPSTSPTSVSALYNGALAAGTTKIIQRLIKYGGEPQAEAAVRKEFPQLSHTTSHFIAGGIVGALETTTVPTDSLLKLKQTESFSQTPSITPSRSYPQMITQENTHLLRAMPVTLCRNMLGTAGFFSAQNVARERIFRVKEGEKLTYQQKLLNSLLCPAAGTITSYPLDVIKTRIQVTPKAAPVQLSAFAHLTDIIKTDGFFALYRGLGQKLATSVPRGAISFFTVQLLTDKFNQTVKPESDTTNKTSVQLKKTSG